MFVQTFNKFYIYIYIEPISSRQCKELFDKIGIDCFDEPDDVIHKLKGAGLVSHLRKIFPDGNPFMDCCEEVSAVLFCVTFI